jgi:hypothetical protein
MMKAFVDIQGGRKMLLLILERGNLDHLNLGHPMHIHAEEIKVPRINVDEILICFFETKEEALKYFGEQGMIDENTSFEHEKPPQ